MRVLLLTDSLGCPRTQIHVEKTWTDRIIKTYKESISFYTMCIHGLSVRNIDFDYIKELELDLIICQIGIVDASRRALKKNEVQYMKKVPYLSEWAHDFCSNNHYKMTKLRNIHDASEKQFNEAIIKLSSLSKRICLIRIAPAGSFMIEKVYNIENDIEAYNSVMYRNQNENISIINPYANHERTSYQLDDGHHLNEFGEELVYTSVSNYLDNTLRDNQ